MKRILNSLMLLLVMSIWTGCESDDSSGGGLLGGTWRGTERIDSGFLITTKEVQLSLDQEGTAVSGTREGALENPMDVNGTYDESSRILTLSKQFGNDVPYVYRYKLEAGDNTLTLLSLMSGSINMHASGTLARQ